MALFRNIFKKGKKNQTETKTGSSYVNDWVSQTTAPGELDSSENTAEATGAMQGVWPYDPKANFSKFPNADEPPSEVHGNAGPSATFDKIPLNEPIIEAERQKVGARKSAEGKSSADPPPCVPDELYDLPWHASTLTIQNMLKEVEKSTTSMEAERLADLPNRRTATRAHTDDESSSDADALAGSNRREGGAQIEIPTILSESYLEPKRQTDESKDNGWTKDRDGYSSDSAAHSTTVSWSVKASALRSKATGGYASDSCQRSQEGNVGNSTVTSSEAADGSESEPEPTSQGDTGSRQQKKGSGCYENDSATISKVIDGKSSGDAISLRGNKSSELSIVTSLRIDDSTSDSVYRKRDGCQGNTSSPVLLLSSGSISTLSDSAAQNLSGQTRDATSRLSSNVSATIGSNTHLQHSKSLQIRRSELNLSSTAKETASSSGLPKLVQRSKDGGGRSRHEPASQSAEGSSKSEPPFRNFANAQGSMTQHTRRGVASFSTDSTASSSRDLGNVTEDDGYYSENRTLLRHIYSENWTLLRQSNSRTELVKMTAGKESNGYGTLRRTDRSEGVAAQPSSIVTASAILDTNPETPAEGFFHMSAVATESLRKLCEDGRNKTTPIPESVLTRQRMSWDDFSFTSDTPLHSNRYCIFYRAAIKSTPSSQLLLMVSLKEPKTTLTARSPHVFGCKPLFEVDVPMRMIPSSFLAANQPSSGQHMQQGANGADVLAQDSLGQYDKPWHESTKAAVKTLESSYHAGLLNTEKFQRDPLRCFATILPPIPDDALSLSSLLQTQKAQPQDATPKKLRDAESLFQILLQVVKVVTSLFFDGNTLCISLKPDDLLLIRRKREPYMIMLSPGNMRKSDIGSGFVVCAQLRKLFEEVAAFCPLIHSTPGYARLEKLIQSAGEIDDVKAIVKVWETVAWGPSEKEVRTLCLAADRDAAFEIWLQVQRLKQVCIMASETMSSTSTSLEQFEKGLFLCSVTGAQLFAVSKLLHAK